MVGLNIYASFGWEGLRLRDRSEYVWLG